MKVSRHAKILELIEKYDIETQDELAVKLREEGFEGVLDADGACWFFERYGCPRFTVPDEKGNVILDIGFFVK